MYLLYHYERDQSWIVEDWDSAVRKMEKGFEPLAQSDDKRRLYLVLDLIKKPVI